MTRTLTISGAAVVLVAALVASTVHLYEVSQAAGAGWLAALTPLAVDGLGLVSAVALWSARQEGREYPGAAVFGFGMSLTASISGNIVWPWVSSLPDTALTTLSAVVSVYPAVALAVAAELTLSVVPGVTPTAPDDETLTPVVDEGPPEPPELTPGGGLFPVPDDPVTRLRHLLSQRPDATSKELAAEVGRSPSWVRGKRQSIRQELPAA